MMYTCSCGAKAHWFAQQVVNVQEEKFGKATYMTSVAIDAKAYACCNKAMCVVQMFAYMGSAPYIVHDVSGRS